MSNPTVIRPEIVASKLAAATNLTQPALANEFAKQPRLMELLWFLQWQSMQPGGLEKFALDLIAEFPVHVGPAALVNAPPGELNHAQCLEIWRKFPKDYQRGIGRADTWQLDSLTGTPQESDADIMARLNRQAFTDSAAQAAHDKLPAWLAALCDEISQTFYDRRPWYFVEIIPTLFAAMDAHARRAVESIAMTEVALKVFDALEYSWQEKNLAQITGDSRFGKTEAVKAWCNAHPGRARLVSTPFSNCDADLYRAVADALGIEHDFKTSPRRLKETVEFSVRHSGLLFIFDESHFLFPTRFSKNTVPMRLNWIRTQMVDRSVPVVLVSTPQDYRHAADKFIRETQYNFAQFLGRIMHQVTLPNELEHDDLLAVAKIHCPEMDADFQELIVAKAMQSESYLHTVQAIGKRARYVARRDGHPEITLADVSLAIAEVIPASATAPAAAVRPAPAAPAIPAPIRPPRHVAAGARPRSIRPAAPPPAPALEIPQRETTPALVAA